MYKKTITYEDYNGVKRTEDFFFNLTKAELFTLEIDSAKGYAETLKTLIKAKDGKTLLKTFMKLIEKAYGVKSDDGKRFMKDPELFKAFSETEAYSQLYMELALNDVEATKFIEGIMPAGMNSITEEEKMEYIKELGLDDEEIAKMQAAVPKTVN